MRRSFLNAKIHRARITGASLDYEGSLAIDTRLMALAGIHANEQVHVVNINNGERFTTYAIDGGDGDMVLNGAAARKGQVGDLVIVMTYADLEPAEIAGHQPRVIHVDEQNRPRSAKSLEAGRPR